MVHRCDCWSHHQQGHLQVLKMYSCMTCWTTLWTCKYAILAVLPHPSSPHWSRNHLWYLQLYPCLLSICTPKLDGRCVHTKFQLAMKIFSQKVLPPYCLLHHYHQWPQGHPFFLTSYYMCVISCVLLKINLAFF